MKMLVIVRDGIIAKELGRQPMLQRPPEDEMCPPGYCIVREYRRANGQLVHPFRRKLPAKDASRLLAENMLYLFWHSDR